MPGTHAFRNPSSSQSWLDCGQWPIIKRWHIDNEVPIPQGDTTHADRGTMLHGIVETLIKMMLDKPTRDPKKLLRSKLVTKLNEHDEEQIGFAFNAALDLMREYGWPDKGVHIGLEVAVPISHEPGSTGKVDLTIVVPNVVLVVADYKFGKGEVESTSFQNRIYASNLLHRLEKKGMKFPSVLLGIIQPEISEDAITSTETPESLDRFRHYVEITTERQESGEDTRPASHASTCTWCPFTRRCPAFEQRIIESLDDAKEVAEETAFPDTLERFYRAKKMIEQALAMARDVIFKDPEQFDTFGRSSRRNPRGFDLDKADESEIAHYLRLNYDIQDPYKLKSPAQIKKMLPNDADIEQFLLPQGYAEVLSMKPKKS